MKRALGFQKADGAPFRKGMAAVYLAMALAGCGGGGSSPAPQPPGPNPPNPDPPAPVRYDFAFAQASTPWLASYTDYREGSEASVEFTSAIETLPLALPSMQAIRLKSNNRPDDVFMYVTRKIEGLVPNQSYRVQLAIRVATQAPANCPGIGGAPGEGVVIKAGAVAAEPARVVVSGQVRSSIDKGDQLQAGTQSLVLGDIANPLSPCVGEPIYSFKSLDTRTATLTVQANSKGEVWVYYGTESGFEGVTDIFFVDAFAVFTKAS